MIHELKTKPEPFNAVVSGQKTFEFRRFDRQFAVGDNLLLREYLVDKKEYTGRSISVNVTYILSSGYGIPSGYCIMSIHR